MLISLKIITFKKYWCWFRCVLFNLITVTVKKYYEKTVNFYVFHNNNLMQSTINLSVPFSFLSLVPHLFLGHLSVTKFTNKNKIKQFTLILCYCCFICNTVLLFDAKSGSCLWWHKASCSVTILLLFVRLHNCKDTFTNIGKINFWHVTAIRLAWVNLVM